MQTFSKSAVPISFVIPTYNYSSFLDKCIVSICRQDYTAHEIIIVDDGSTDQTTEVVEALTDRFQEIRIRYFYQKNSGPSAARNLGVNKASGAYIWFVDADDILLEGAVRLMTGAVQKYPDAGLVFSGYRSVDQAGLIKNHQPGPLKGDRVHNFKQYLLKKTPGLTTGSVVVHRKVFQKLSFPGGIHNNEDIVFFSHVLAAFPAACVPGIILEKYRHEGSLRKDIERIRQTGLKIVDALFNPELIGPETMVFRNRFHARRCLSIFRSFFLAESYDEAAGYYRQAVRMWPRLVFKWPYLKKYIQALIKKRK